MSSLITATPPPPLSFLFFFNDTATTEIYTLSLHDALPISALVQALSHEILKHTSIAIRDLATQQEDRKSTRLNSSHGYISYAVFCLKKKKRNTHANRHSLHNCSSLPSKQSTPPRSTHTWCI